MRDAYSVRLTQRTPKVLRKGTHRSQSLEGTWQRASRLAPVMGITRVANVTGLDSVGIPVVMVCRPNSRSVAVSQGKGVDLASARVSGLMEAIELYHAETITLPLRLATYEELRYNHNVVEPEKLPSDAGSQFHPNLRLLWCEGHDLISGENVLIPYETVHTDYTTPLPDGHGCFTASSNGLASGNDLLEAVSHGICEIVERDATTLWKLRGEKDLETRQLDLGSVDDASCRELLEKLEGAGLTVHVWDVTSEIELAAFACYILPKKDGDLWHHSVAAGFGCHPSRPIALARALTEAAQSRLTVIAGVRDDFGREVYAQCLDSDFVEAVRRRGLRAPPIRRFQDVPHWDAETLEEDVKRELTCLKQAGIDQVVVIDLTKREFGLPVVRVLVPGLEPMLVPEYTPGRRGQAVLKKMS